MAEIYCPFESLNTGTVSDPVYDRAITAEMERSFNKLRYTNGVFSSVGSGLAVSANNNMTVTVGTGGAHIEGAMYINTAPLNLAVEAANASLNRIDRVVLQFNTSVSVRSIRALIRTGTAATNPVAPELRQESNLFEIALADIYVKKGATGIAQSAITDQRLNSALCGFVVAAIPSSVDTTGLFDQYQASLNEWLDTVAAALDDTLAGNLQNQITALGTRLTAEENKVQPINKGGTGATTAEDALIALLENKALPIAKGGTGATTPAAALAALGGVSMEKVWSNASPTSTFKPQKVTITDDGYDAIDMVFLFSTNYAQTVGTMRIWLNTTRRHILNGTWGSNATRGISPRKSDGKIILDIETGNNYLFDSTGGSANNNTYAIPLEAYGVKGVL